jgi:hypothetical protein
VVLCYGEVEPNLTAKGRRAESDRVSAGFEECGPACWLFRLKGKNINDFFTSGFSKNNEGDKNLKLH